jgi:ATP-binding cassette subfamily B protein
LQGRIELRLVRHEANARLTITDGRHAVEAPGGRSGVARPESPVRLRLVQPRQADEPELPQPHGTDMPLDPLQLRSTIEREGGSFRIEAAGSTHGLRYVVELPLRATASERREAPPPPAEMPEDAPPPAELGAQPLAGLHLVTIDDRDDARESLQALLETDGAEVKGFESGRDAIEWLSQHGVGDWPHVLLCDIALGDEDGYAVMRHIRQLEQQRGVPLDQRMPAIALTGLAEQGDRMRALMAGFQMHLAKPVDPHELVSALTQLTGRSGGGGGQPSIAAA